MHRPRPLANRFEYAPTSGDRGEYAAQCDDISDLNLIWDTANVLL